MELLATGGRGINGLNCVFIETFLAPLTTTAMK